MKKTITRPIDKQRAKDICCEGDSMQDEGITFYERGEWEDDGKYQYQDIIFQEKGHEGYWMLFITRSGGYFTDHDYQYDTEATLVEPKEIVKTEWVTVQAKEDG